MDDDGDWRELSASLDLAPMRLSLLRPPQISSRIHSLIGMISSVVLCAMCLDLLNIICEYVREHSINGLRVCLSKASSFPSDSHFPLLSHACANTHPESRVCLSKAFTSLDIPSRDLKHTSWKTFLMQPNVGRAMCSALEISHVILSYYLVATGLKAGLLISLYNI